MKQLIYIILLCTVGFVGIGCNSSKTANLSLELWCGPAEIPAQLNARATKVARSLSERNNNVLVYCDSRDSVILSTFSASPTGNILSIYTVKANSTTQFDTIYNQSFDWIYSFGPQKDAAYGFWEAPSFYSVMEPKSTPPFPNTTNSNQSTSTPSPTPSTATSPTSSPTTSPPPTINPNPFTQLTLLLDATAIFIFFNLDTIQLLPNDQYLNAHFLIFNNFLIIII